MQREPKMNNNFKKYSFTHSLTKHVLTDLYKIRGGKIQEFSCDWSMKGKIVVRAGKGQDETKK